MGKTGSGATISPLERVQAEAGKQTDTIGRVLPDAAEPEEAPLEAK